MKFECSTAQLMGALNAVSRAIPTNPIIALMECVLVEAYGDSVKITATDSAMSIEAVFPATIVEDGRIAITGKLFTEVVKKLTDDIVTVSVNEKNVATIKCGKSKTNLSGHDAQMFPELPTVDDGDSFSMEQGTLKDMIDKTSFAVAQDETRTILTGCLLDVKEHEIRMVALDGFRLAMRKEVSEEALPEASAVVSGKMLGDIAKVLANTDDPAEITIGQKNLRVKTDQACVIARRLEGDFIEYERIIPKEFATTVKAKRNELLSATERTALLAREGKNHLVHFNVTGDEMTLSSAASVGDAMETVNVITEGKDIAIAFNVRYISGVLKAVDDEAIQICLNTNVNPCIIRQSEGEEYLFLVLPVRVASGR